MNAIEIEVDDTNTFEHLNDSKSHRTSVSVSRSSWQRTVSLRNRTVELTDSELEIVRQTANKRNLSRSQTNTTSVAVTYSLAEEWTASAFDDIPKTCMFHPKNTSYWVILYLRCAVSFSLIFMAIWGAGFFRYFGKSDSLTIGAMNLGFFLLNWILDAGSIALMVLETVSLRHLRHGDCTSRRALIKHRLRDITFWADMISIFPLDLIFALQGQMHVAYLARLMKLFQLVRLYSIVNYIGAARQYNVYVDPLLRWITSWFIALFFAWWSLGAIVHSTSRSRYISNPNDSNWLPGFYFNNPDLKDSTIHSFVGVMYYVIVTMCAVGYGDISPTNTSEVALATLIQLTGFTIFANVVGCMVPVFMQWLQQETTTSDQKLLVDRIMDNMHVDRQVRRRVGMFWDHFTKKNNGVDPNSVFANHLPLYLRREIGAHLIGKSFQSSKYLDEIHLPALRCLCDNLRFETYVEKDLIISAGSVPSFLPILLTGRVEELDVDADGHMFPFKVISLEHTLAEEYFVKQVAAPRRFAATETCYVALIHHSDWQRVEIQHPEISSKVHEETMKMSNKMSILQKASPSKKQRQMISMDEDEFKERSIEGMFYPHSTFVKRWRILLLFSQLVYISVNTSLIAFGTLQPLFDHPTNYAVLIIIDFCFLADAILRCYYLAIEKEGKTITDPDEVKKHYKATQLKFDIAASFPFELILVTFIPTFAVWGRINRYLRLVEFNNAYHKVADMTNVGGNVRRMVQASLFLLVIFHTMGSIWFLTGVLEQGAGATNTWIASDMLDGAHVSTFHRYVRSVYFSVLSSFTVGYGGIVPESLVERMVNICLVIFGTALFFAMMAMITVWAELANRLSVAFEQKLEVLNAVLDKLEISGKLVVDCRAYLEHLWSYQFGEKARAIFELLPIGVRSQIVFQSCEEAFKKIPFFEATGRNFVLELCAKMEWRTFVPGEVMYDGQVTEFFIVQNGSCFLKRTATQEDNFETLNRGDCWGAGVMSPVLGTRSVHWEGIEATRGAFVDVFTLSKEDFDEVATRFPIVNALATQDTSRLEDEELQEILDSPDLSRFLEEDQLKKLRHRASIRRQSLRTPGDRLSVNSSANTMLSPNALWDRLQLIHPASNERCFWNVARLFFILYYTAIVPYQFAFTQPGSFPMTIIADIFVDLFFLVDVFLNYNYFAIEEKSFVCTDLKVIRHKYRYQMVFDLISSVPWDLPLVFFNPKWYFYSRAVRLVKLVYLGPIINQLELWIEQSELSIKPASIRITKQILLVFIIAHFAASSFYLVGESDTSGRNWLRNTGSPIFYGAVEHDEGYSFLVSYYWSFVTISSVGFGDIKPLSLNETIVGLIVMLCGVTFYSAATAFIASFLAHANPTGELFQRKNESVKEIVRQFGVSKQTDTKIKRYMNELWKTFNGIMPREAFSHLSTSLNRRALSTMHIQALESVKEFRAIPKSFWPALLARAKSNVYLADQELFSNGSVSDRMCILIRGNAKATGGDHRGVVHVSGSVIHKEHMLLESLDGVRVNGSVIAVTACHVSIIYRADFDEIMQLRPTWSVPIEDARASYVDKKPMTSSRTNRRKSMTAFMEKVKEASAGTTPAKIAVGMLLFDFAVFNLWMIPFQSAYLDGSNLLVTFIICWVSDVFFWAQWIHYLLNEKPREYRDLPMTRSMTFWKNLECYPIHCAVNFISLVPIDVIMCATMGFKAGSHWRFLRLFQVRHVWSYLDMMWNTFLPSANGSIRLLCNTLLYFYCGVHILGCSWFIAGDSVYPNWLSVVNLSSGDPVSKRYLYSVYFVSTTVTTTGYGDVLPQHWSEIVFTMILILAGNCLYAGVIGRVSSWAQSTYATSLQSHERRTHLTLFCNSHNIPKKLTKRVMDYDKAASLTKMSEEMTQKEFPQSIREEIAMELYSRVLFDSCYFGGYSRNMMRLLVPHVKREVFTNGSVILSRHDTNDQLYLILMGRVAMLMFDSPDDAQPSKKAYLKKNVWVGEESFFLQEPIKNSFVACSQVVLLSIDRDTFLETTRQGDFEEDVHPFYVFMTVCKALVPEKEWTAEQFTEISSKVWDLHVSVERTNSIIRSMENDVELVSNMERQVSIVGSEFYSTNSEEDDRRHTLNSNRRRSVEGPMTFWA